MMNNSAKPEWILTDETGIGRDRYNWILYRKFGKKWRPEACYRRDPPRATRSSRRSQIYPDTAQAWLSPSHNARSRRW